MKNFLTTSETAEICGVAHTSVIRWITDGKLKAHETPGGHRRIQRGELASFMKQFDIPVPASFSDGKFRILAVDDDRHVLASIRNVFSNYTDTIDLQTTLSGMDALVMLGKRPCDLIILDVIMPGMDGIQFCKTLKKNPETTAMKIIAITGKQLTDEQEHYLEVNTACILRKPFLPSALFGKVKALM